MEILIIVILVGVFIYGFTEKKEKKRDKLDSDLAVKQAQKEEDANADIVSYGQVQERKAQLIDLIDENLEEHPEQSAQLKDIIEDWANLKVESFENRRSWVRSPKQKKED
jgi:uncharacterized membrane-anchored protein YhcB (DUF1043 family)